MNEPLIRNVAGTRIDHALAAATTGHAAVPAGEAEILLAAVLGRDRASLRAFPEGCLNDAEHSLFRDWIAARADGTPIAYVLGEREFWSLPIRVSPAVLIPRPETEHLVEAALAHCLPGAAILDIGTGSGAIAIALAHTRADISVTAVERSREALAVATANAERLTPGRIEFLAGDWYCPVASRRFDVIVANPPYIGADEPELATGDVRFEPAAALVAGADGLAALRHVIAGAAGHLAAGGVLLTEHGWTQGEAVRGFFAAAGLERIETLRDLAGHERLTLGFAGNTIGAAPPRRRRAPTLWKVRGGGAAPTRFSPATGAEDRGGVTKP